MLLTFTTRRMVRWAHLALSPIRFIVQFDFAVSDRHSYEKMHTASLGTARWAHLSTSHPIGLMWWLVLRWAHLAFPTMPYAYIPGSLGVLWGHVSSWAQCTFIALKIVSAIVSGLLANVSNAVVISGNSLHYSHADFFPFATETRQHITAS